VVVKEFPRYEDVERERCIEAAREAYVNMRRARHPSYRLPARWSDDFWWRVHQRAASLGLSISEFMTQAYYEFSSKYKSENLQPNMLTSIKINVRRDGALADAEADAENTMMYQLTLVQQVLNEQGQEGLRLLLSGQIEVNPLVLYYVGVDAGDGAAGLRLANAVAFVRTNPKYRKAAERILPAEVMAHV
jgi:hypothetical protein